MGRFTKTPYLVLFVILGAIGIATASAIGIIILAGNVVIEGDLDMTNDKISDCKNCKIESAIIDPTVKVSLPFFGDLWHNTIASDGKLYLPFGDGTGEGMCIPTTEYDTPPDFVNGCYDLSTSEFMNNVKEISPLFYDEFCEFNDCNTCFTDLCQYTPAGIVVTTGNPPDLIQSGSTIKDVPYGNENIFKNSDKISTMLFVDDRLYAHIHYPPAMPSNGYMAYSDDNGINWQIIPGVDWNGNSNFKTSMFVQLHNKDSFVYTLGVQNEVNWELFTAKQPIPQQVYLNRVDRNSITDFSSFEYFSGLVDGNPTWSSNESDAIPLDTLETIITGSAMYHAGLDRYLFLSGWDSSDPHFLDLTAGLYESENLWGEWHKVATLPVGYISSFIPKGFDDDYFYFTGGGLGDGAGYNLNVGKMQLQLKNNE